MCTTPCARVSPSPTEAGAQGRDSKALDEQTLKARAELEAKRKADKAAAEVGIGCGRALLDKALTMRCLGRLGVVSSLTRQLAMGCIGVGYTGVPGDGVYGHGGPKL